MSVIQWFGTSPDAGDPTCICSWCGKPIGENELPIIRMFDTDTSQEARFHSRCASAAGVVSLPPIGAFDDLDDEDLPD